MTARTVEAGARAFVGAVVLLCAWAVTLGQAARLARRRERLSERMERLGLMDDHLAEWR